MESQKVLAAIITSLGETKDFNKKKTVKGGQGQCDKHHKDMPTCLQIRSADTVIPAICPEDSQPMEKSDPSVARSTT